MRHLFFRIELYQGEMIGPWHGVAWRDIASGRDVWVCYPLGLNLVAIFLRWIYVNIRNPYWYRRAWHRHSLQVYHWRRSR